ncbi:P-loop containing nucleoside triphosphate hydrolase protein [Bimuria novae-zelandiae CBS 107.79]|uniref:P-loop containing nucleoside triphosphate hydrolase protein n=1 Tax=Bimuria novae-zelandiae CBS 107.79 TaxID=1447943 RepID=A0A6A5VJP5_9PLEO|nr:P-loop containing nucleoside triphosphate hydrolase protein [Bimuria novae-zelandiae CBS 107.79]
MPPTPLLLAISGPSSSGKTTLSRLLRDIFPSSTLSLLHLDDFYHTDAAIPLKNGVQDWDCIESLNLPLLRSTLSYIKEHGHSPPDFVSKEDQNSVGEHGVPPHVVEKAHERITEAINDVGWKRKVCVVDGFLLFSEAMKEIRDFFDVKLFLRTSYATAKRRREARSGYVTLEGFWADPPGYVDQIVWPNYVADHKFLFQGGDVEGELDEGVCKRVGIEGMPREAEGDMGVCLEWAVGVLEGVIRGEGKGA